MPEGSWRDVNYLPPNSRVRVERQPDGLTIAVSPNRELAMWCVAIFGLILFGGFLYGMIFFLQEAAFGVAGACTFFVVLGALALLYFWYGTTRRAILTVTSDGLTAGSYRRPVSAEVAEMGAGPTSMRYGPHLSRASRTGQLSFG